MSQPAPLVIDKVLATIGPDGHMSRSLKGFESRPQQQEMMRNIIDAYHEDKIALIEAGTGTGKSFAYLIPAILWSLKNQETTVISTNTINLQEQLLHKDIPLVCKALGVNIKAVLVKGMGNYACKRKIEDSQMQLRLFQDDEARELNRIYEWNEGTKDGSRSDLHFFPSYQAWEKVGAEHDTCNKKDCSHFENCHYFNARKHSTNAQILIVNHHLLFCDIVQRAEMDKYDKNAILPPYKRIIIDEAHNIEDIATDFFASNLNKLDILRLLSRLCSEKQSDNSHGKLPLLTEKIHQNYQKQIPADISSILSRLQIDIPGQRRDVLALIHEAFDTFNDLIHQLKQQDEEESKIRLRTEHQSHTYWAQMIKPRCNQLIASIKRLNGSLSALEKDLQNVPNEKLLEKTSGVRYEITALNNRLAAAIILLDTFVNNPVPSNKVRWVEAQEKNTQIVDANLDVSKAIVENLFSKFSTVVLCSATLTTNKKFNYFRSRLGLVQELLPEKTITENIYPSPFNFKKQALLTIPTDMPDPTSPNFVEEATQRILSILEVSRGSAFVLFTSYHMLKTCHNKLKEALEAKRFNVLKQGDEGRQTLLNKFKCTERSVLFGTDSFWEGVDVAGEALRCVIIVKLPFKVPSEPIFQARTEAILEREGNPFMEYAVPNAIVKFKQGFGRLIRHKKDRGCVVCLDNRLLTKNYGRMFINSLPECEKRFVTTPEMLNEMQEFYKRTYYLTKT